MAVPLSYLAVAAGHKRFPPDGQPAIDCQLREGYEYPFCERILTLSLPERASYLPFEGADPLRVEGQSPFGRLYLATITRFTPGGYPPPTFR